MFQKNIYILSSANDEDTLLGIANDSVIQLRL
jgi:hypothetical protein